ncbi:hypothetical protein ANAPC5_01195 [Anaplasma phagocytophilum]|nr:hypothetical protein ANAPC5_01195 [Anaplasma phagocytophilum]
MTKLLCVPCDGYFVVLRTKMHTNNVMITGLLTNKRELGFNGKVIIHVTTKGRNKFFSVVYQRPGK